MKVDGHPLNQDTRGIDRTAVPTLNRVAEQTAAPITRGKAFQAFIRRPAVSGMGVFGPKDHAPRNASRCG